jgi:hypothetical protein
MASPLNGLEERGLSVIDLSTTALCHREQTSQYRCPSLCKEQPESNLLTLDFSNDAINLPQSVQRQWLGISAALCVQAGLLSAATGHVVEATILTLISSLAWASSFSSHQGFSPRQTRRALLVSTSCVLLCASFLLYLRTRGGSGGFDSSNSSFIKNVHRNKFVPEVLWSRTSVNYQYQTLGIGRLVRN